MKAFDSVTGEVSGILEQSILKVGSELTCIAIHPSRENVILACSSSGEILAMPMSGEPAELVIRLDRGISKIQVCKETGSIFCSSIDCQRLYQVNLVEGKRAKSNVILKQKFSSFSASLDGNFLAWAHEKRICVWSVLTDPDRKAIQHADGSRSVHGLCWSEHDLVAALTSGSMVVIRQVASTALFTINNAPLHWHANTIKAMESSPADGHLVSGGDEAVAVIWNLKTGKNQFLPRLGAPITNISVSVDGSKWLVSTEDNAVFVVSSASFKVVCEIRGLTYSSRHESCDLRRYDGNRVILSGRPGNLQLYDVVQDKHIALLPITQENRVSGLPEQSKGPRSSEVRLTAFRGADYMATWEALPKECGQIERSTLRIWKFDKNTLTYLLVGVFDNPHGSQRQLTSMAFSPSGPVQLITTDSEGNFRVWTFEESKDSNEKTENWYLASKRTHHKGIGLGSAVYSADGSILAMTCGPSVVLFNGETLDLVHSFTYSVTNKMVGCLFLDSAASLVAWDEAQISVWDLESLSLSWSINMNVQAITSLGDRFSVACASVSNPADSYVAEFEPKSTRPVKVSKHLGRQFAALTYVKVKSSSSGNGKAKSKQILMGLESTGARCFVQAFPEAEPATDIDAVPVGISSPASLGTALSKLILESADRASERLVMEPCAVAPQWNLKEAKPKDLLLTDIPSHALPPMRLLFASYIKLRLSKNN